MTSRLTPGVVIGVLGTLLFGCGDDSDGASASTSGAGGAAPGKTLEICETRPDHKPTAIYGSDRTMLAMMDDGTLYCWRENGTGQCDAETFGQLFSYPIRVPNLPCVVKAAAGNVGIAMTADGRALTWGIELWEERGDGMDAVSVPNEPSELPVRDVTDVSARGSAMGLLQGDQAHWWGLIDELSALPKSIGTGKSRAIEADPATSCLLGEDAIVSCWGRSTAGILGPGRVTSPEPALSLLTAPAESLSVARQTACAVLDDDEIWCWGSNFTGELGRGEPDELALLDDPIPAQIDAPGPFEGVVVADGTVCAWRPTGEVLCWGHNYIGLYAPIDGTPQTVPRRVPELEPAKQVAVVYDEVCALGLDDVVRCRVHEPKPSNQQPARLLDFINPPPQPEP